MGNKKRSFRTKTASRRTKSATRKQKGIEDLNSVRGYNVCREQERWQLFLTFAHAWGFVSFSRPDVSYHVSQFRPWSILLKSSVDSTSTASCSSRMAVSKSGPHDSCRTWRDGPAGGSLPPSTPQLRQVQERTQPLSVGSTLAHLVPRRATRRSLLAWHLLLGNLSLGQLLLLSLLLLVLSVDVTTLGPSCTDRHVVSNSIQQLFLATKTARDESDRCIAKGRLTLLWHSTVVHRSCLGWVSATAVLLLLSSVHLRVSSHRVTLLRMSVGHLRHAGVLHATVAAAHPKTAHHSAASGRVAASRTVVRGLVDANGATVKSECRALASIQNKRRVLHRI